MTIVVADPVIGVQPDAGPPAPDSISAADGPAIAGNARCAAGGEYVLALMGPASRTRVTPSVRERARAVNGEHEATIDLMVPGGRSAAPHVLFALALLNCATCFSTTYTG